ncbi:MAG TPA: MotA/TolQ/ExbB proton channel family protein [Bacteroidales bacterium]|nr:MotA/TolQ/ExbB proton channel family protein [Bacteroidales bacterium]
MLGIILQITQSGALADTTASVVQQVQQVQQAAPTSETLSLWALTMKGGWIMIPIGILSVLAIYIFIERFIATQKAAKEDPGFMNNIRDFIHQGKIDSALSLSKNTDTPIARMLHKGLLRLGRPLNDINTTIENVGKLEVAKLEKKVAILAMAAGGAPMLGFLGTVTGMVRAFYNMSKAGNNIEIATLSGGIYEAMVTTVAGLIVGIIAFFCYNIIVSRIQKVVNMLESRTSEFMDLLNEPAS